MTDVVLVVYCDAESHSTPFGPLVVDPDAADHLPDDVVVLGEFTRDDAAVWQWFPMAAHRKSEQHLAADGSVIPLWGLDLGRQAEALERSTPVGRRYELRCRECGLKAPWHGEAKLRDRLNGIVAQGISGISLAGMNGNHR
ncbi:hypothetical protein MARA_18520 [Mycolicibacterium arabiense]|uniref:Uncharacterized protein n=1 Tax=Mycolicibacterium arabiense TaxID=1286181 RepID=A0A7I7RUV4_9MYCO|nr:hypothetical protein [Mycolicibacterium arabiense]MCV7375238.1 hypothetical protein [Mycolicibacterium arabiense]BBY48384.1 hypothetical protein MARA_18520 [Mycolicibacterium arabiense]